MSLLTEQVKNNIKSFLPKFQEWLKSDEAKQFIEERNNKEKETIRLLNEANIGKLTELDFRQIIASLWAYTGFTNKDYVADRILKSTDFNTIKSELKNLLYGDKPLSIRYDEFFEKVKGIGPAGVTEILAFVKKDQYGIWNDKSRKALKMLGLEEKLPVEKYKINGSEYELINDVLKSISKIIKPEEEHDLIFVDFFLYYIVTYISEKEVTIEIEDYSFDHDEIVDMLVEIGNGLGFEAESEKLIAKGARVDVVWQAKIANLGILNYVFEVHHAGSIDSLILNLQRARNNPTVQKLVIVANKKNINKIKEEVASLSEDFRKSLVFFEAKDVEKIAELWRELSSILSKLELVKSF
jgi:hypothetical protein